MDKLTPSERSKNMSKIRSANTKPEMIVRSFLRKKGIGYRKNLRSMPGTPDIVCTKYKTVIFINGCFWHGHDGCINFVIPSTRTEWWMDKIMKNRSNDRINQKKIIESGWTVVVVWECELKKRTDETLTGLLFLLKSKQISPTGQSHLRG